MLYSISGRVTHKGENFAVVEAGGVGFRIFSHPRALSSLAVSVSATLYLYLYVREDALDLYGFLTPEELRFFELLNSVAGVGPKSALSILEIADLKQLSAAIKEGRPDLLTRASGIGRKTAERIILELRSKVQLEKSEAVIKKMESDADIVELLANLGYRREEAKTALQKVDEKITGVEARLKAALKNLTR